MFKVEMSKIGITTEYLADTEQEQSHFDIDFNNPNLQEFLTKNNIKPEEYTLDYRAKYLEQENPHYKAKIFGGLAEKWEINEYSRETYVDLISGKFPKSAGKRPDNIKKNGNIIKIKQNAQSGLDTLANGPKSVSIEFARGPKQKRDLIHQCFEKSTDELMKRIAKQAKPSCQDPRYQDFIPESTKIIAVSFNHYENRGYEDEESKEWRLEPNLHAHISIANYAEFEVYVHDENGNRIVDENGDYKTERKIFAISAEDIFKSQLENSAIFDTLLNSNLQQAGFKTEYCEVDGHKTFRIAGYTKEMEERLSVRSQGMKKYVEEQKKLGNIFSSDIHAETEYMKSLRQNTAKGKSLHDTAEILENISKTVDLNISKEEQRHIDYIQQNSKQEKRQPDLESIAKDAMFETDGVVQETKIRSLLVQELRFKKNYTSLDEIDRDVDKALDELCSKKFNKYRLVQMEDGRYTRLDIIANERALKNNIDGLNGLSKPKQDNKAGKDFLKKFYNEKKENGFELNEGQIWACKNIIRESIVSMLIGDAGTGKTTSAIRFAYEYYLTINKANVYGISVATSQSRDLKDADIPKENCLNSKEFIQKAFNCKTGEINKDFLKENLNSVLIFDEAGMCGSEDMRKITDFVKAVNQLGGSSRLMLVGDHKQLQSVSYGNAFVNIQNQLSRNDISRLTENTRQKNQVAKDIAEGYKRKDIDFVFQTLSKNNLLITEKKQDKVIEKLVSDYLKDANKSKIIICGLNEEIDKVNDYVRAGLIEQERAKAHSSLDFENSKSIRVARTSGNGQDFARNREFCKGEEIVFLKNSNKSQKKQGFDVSNSDRGIIKKIKKIDKDNYELTVIVKEKEVVFKTSEYNYFNNCYAISTHKSQGKTVDHTYHLGNPNLARYQNSYVNGSRHKEQYKLYLVDDQVEAYKKNAVKEAVKATTLGDENCENALKEYVFEETAKKRNLPKPMPGFKHKALDKHAHLKTAKEIADKKAEEEKEKLVHQYNKKLEKEDKYFELLEELKQNRAEQKEAEKIAREMLLAKLPPAQRELYLGLQENLTIKKDEQVKPAVRRKR